MRVNGDEVGAATQHGAWHRARTLSQQWPPFMVRSAYHPLPGRGQAGARSGVRGGGGGGAEEEIQASEGHDLHRLSKRWGSQALGRRPRSPLSLRSLPSS